VKIVKNLKIITMKNIADILKDCPKGTKLYSPIFGEVELEKALSTSILVKGKSGLMADFYVDGKYHSNGECMLFPSKENSDWNKFSPFKEGDVLYIDCNDDEDACEQNQYIFILKQISEGKIDSYCYINGTNESKFETCWLANMEYRPRFATEEEKDKLFKTIKNNGYKWNSETKILEDLVVPKFKVGDKIVKRNSISHSWIVSFVSSEYYGLTLPDGRESIGVLPISEQDSWVLVPIVPIFNVEDKIKRKGDSVLFTIKAVDYNHYIMEPINSSDGFNNCNVLEYISFNDQNNYELVPDKFDINTLKPFDQVLVRTNNFNPVWTIDFYDGYNPKIGGSFRPFGVSGGKYFQQCIPYKGNEHLRGTTNECDEYYKNW
jgi:hypothetical protein